MWYRCWQMNRDLESAGERHHAGDMIVMFVSDDQSVYIIGAYSQLTETFFRGSRRQAAIDQNDRVLRGDNSGVSSASAGKNSESQ